MLSWLRTLTREERLTFFVCLAGWGLDAMDNQSANLALPTIVKVFGVSTAQVGLMATLALVASGIGGWAAGALSDRWGRVKVLQLTIAWFSIGSLLCGLSQTFPQLVAARVIQGLGFGGEWAAGAILIGEITRPQYRATAVGAVQSGYSLGTAAASGLFFAAYSLLQPALAWRAVFLAGVLPALLVVVVQKSVREPPRTAMAVARKAGGLDFLKIFSGPILKFTLIASALSLAIQGASYSIVVWLPTLLRTERHFSVGQLSSFFLLQSLGAFIGYLCAAVFADRLGRRNSIWIFTFGCLATTAALTVVPIGATPTLALAAPFGFFALGIYSNFGPVLTEIYPTALRGSGQGFCYNFGRGVGAVFPALVGYLGAHGSFSRAMAEVSLTSYGVTLLLVFLLPETRGKELTE